MAAGQAQSATAATGALRGAGSGKCLDVPNASTTPGAQSQIYSCYGGANRPGPVRPTAGSR